MLTQSLKQLKLPPYKLYDEVPQQRPCKFAFAKIKGNTVRALHSPVLCRDFLNDTLVKRAGEKKEKLNVYKYTYSGKTLDTEKCVLLIYDWEGADDNEKVLQDIELELGICMSRFFRAGDDAVCVIGDKWWMENTVKFSWYTTVLRGLSYEDKIESLEEIPEEDWMDGVYHKFLVLWKKFKDMPNLGVAGASDSILKDMDWECVHDYNGWRSQLRLPTFTRYGAYLNGKA